MPTIALGSRRENAHESGCLSQLAHAPTLDSYDLRPRLKLWIESEDGRVALSEWGVMLLPAIAEYGSLVAAARSLGVPHRTAWQCIREMQSSLVVRPLETTSGGVGGGQSSLSPAAQDFVKRYEAFGPVFDDMVGERFQKGFHELNG